LLWIELPMKPGLLDEEDSSSSGMEWAAARIWKNKDGPRERKKRRVVVRLGSALRRKGEKKKEEKKKGKEMEFGKFPKLENPRKPR
jgi:hypothetical protein